jgi:elongation factor P hydroxylase
MLTPSQAYALASSWGSFIRAGDPGAVFYSFRVNDARPDSERHRRQCLAYVRGLLKSGLSEPAMRELRALRAFFQNTGLRA